MSWQIILYTFSAGMFYAILAIGFGLILRSVKFFNVAYGGAFLVGGYTMFFFYRAHAFAFWLSLFLSLGLAGLYMLLTYKFVFSPLLRRRASNFILLIASFGILTATSAALGIIFGSQSTLIARQLSDVYTINIFGGVLSIVQVMAIVCGLLAICAFAFLRTATGMGRAVRALEDDTEVAELVGIPKEKIISQLFFLSGILAGLVGIFEGLDVGLTPATGLFYILPVIVIAIVGGIRSFWGGIVGAFILAIAQELTVIFLGGNWIQAVPFVVLIIILLVRPEGILKR